MSKKRTSVSAPAKSATGKAAGPMDVGLLEQIVKLMAANDLNTVDVRDGDRRVILKRGAVHAAASPMVYSTALQAPATTPSKPASVPPTPAAPADDTAGLVPVKSPMVGTFYSAASPEAKPFVSVGSTVTDETVVCVIEAMKVFNNIVAETRGSIAKVLITNGQTVEFGQTLFWVKP